jgi:GntR family transcriptional repressor for pyruvate dehydrogenase complex
MASVDEADRRISVFRPLRMRKAAEEVVAVIVDAIRGGIYEPGEKLPRERDLAAALEVSRAVVREAVGILERAGIVTVRRGVKGGIVVVTRWIPTEVIAAIEGETYASMRSVLEVRRIVETQAALLAGERRTDDDVAELTRLVDLLPGLREDPEEFLAVDMRFHVRVAEATANEFLAELVRETMRRLASLRAEYPVGHIDIDQALRNQEHTLAAIVSSSQARIARSIDEHLGDAEEYFLGERLKRE